LVHRQWDVFFQWKARAFDFAVDAGSGKKSDGKIKKPVRNIYQRRLLFLLPFDLLERIPYF
jgi:hypothetical protein